MKKFHSLTLTLLVAFGSLRTQEAGPSPRHFQLCAESPQFWKLVPQDAKPEAVAKGFGCTEGPVWDPSGFLYVSDEELNKIAPRHAGDIRGQRPHELAPVAQP